MTLQTAALIASSLGFGALAVSSLLRGFLPKRWQDVWIGAGLLSLVVGTALGALSVAYGGSSLPLWIGAVGLGACGTAYLQHRRLRSRHFQIGRDFEFIDPENEEELKGTPEGLIDEGTTTPGGTDKPSGPDWKEPAPEPTCVLQHLEGYTWLRVKLSGGGWRSSFIVYFSVYVRGQRMDFYINGNGSVSWGFYNEEYKVRISHDELYGNITCLDQCTKIRWDPWGTSMDTDGPLAASFKIEPQMVDSDTLYVYVTAAASMDGTVEVTSAIPNAPMTTVSERPTQVTKMLGSNVFKCVVVSDIGAAAVQ